MHPSASTGASPSSLRILGVDPAAAGPTGYAIIEVLGRECRVLHYGALKVPAKRQQSSQGAVLHDVHQLLCRLIREFQPQVMAVESVFTALNVRTALRLAEVRGVVLLAAEQAGLSVRSYSPREIKACVAGYGHADKRQMQQMVRVQLGLKDLPEPSDAADALAVALCHLQTGRLEQRFGVNSAALARSSRRNSPNPVSRSPRVTASRIASIQSDR
ncbi:MAG TPA: crossover junction endodeoxyribonuclease RuvC [Candidatus Saccharimonadales bacterium]|nr:crossover junction endodeoxyribonuclease RuvC [Candidatus Saccharimonadales bacterium]